MEQNPLLLSFFLLLPLIGSGERPLYHASLGAVDSSGFYSIPLKPVHTRHLRKGLGDLRLYANEKEKEVPFFVRTVEKERAPSIYRELEPLKVKQKGGYTGIVLEKPQGSTLRKLVFYLEEARRGLRVRVEGSEDRKSWKVLKPEERIRSTVADTASSEFTISGFLGSDHRYYRIRVGSPPPPSPTLTTIGYRERPKGASPYQELPEPRFEQKEHQDKSYVRIEADTLRRVDMLEIRLEGPRFFRRSSTVAVPEEKGSDPPIPYHPIGGAVLSDTLETLEELKGGKAAELLLIITNDAGPPLKVKEIRLFQERRLLVAYLEKGKAYHLKLGGAGEELPAYDLQHYKERIPKDPPLLQAGPPQMIRAAKTAKGERSPLWIWLSVLVSMLVLGAFSYRSVKEGKD